MNSSAPRRPVARIVLISALVVSVIVLAVVAAVLVPILTHQSAGGSGQTVPVEYVSESSATGEDGRTRELSVANPDGTPADLGAVAPGDELVVSGTGFDAGIGIYVGFCAIPENPANKPGPCLGGIPEGAKQGKAAGAEALSSAWITDDWAWRAFATQGYDDSKTGAFEVRLTVPDATIDGLDCAVDRCALVTRADHTALRDRVQDILLPIRFT